MPRTRKNPGDDAPRIFRTEEELAQLPVSERIRYRLVDAGQRYHANDNIAAFLREGELAELRTEVQAKVEDLLRALVIDTDSDHNTQDTASAWPRCTLKRSSAGATCPCPR
jgi:GTP cyclohydrolase I